jgi:uncharacterized protein DUF2779
MDQGREVGLLARQLFPRGIEVAGFRGLDEAISVTKELVTNPDVPAIFEGAFYYQGVIVKTDILVRRNNHWRLVEVKSTTNLKEHHIEDVAIQSYVVSHSGVNLRSAWLGHVNRSYVLDGKSVDPRQFFLFHNLTRRAQDLQPTLASDLRSQFRVLDMPTPQDVSTGQHCINPYVCEFFLHCNHPKAKDYIGHIPRLHASAIEQLEKMGIESIHEITADFELSEFQRRACTAMQTGRPWFSEELKTDFESLSYPLYFMDIETVNPAIPRFAGMHPYDHLPFQWSVHMQKQLGAAPEHLEFLATDRGDPRRAFISSLSDALGEHGTIIVYNQQFESERLWELAGWLPEYTQCIRDMQGRLLDLLRVIRNCSAPLRTRQAGPPNLVQL